MQVTPVENYTPPYPGKPEQRKKAAIRAAAILSASLFVASSVEYRPQLTSGVSVDIKRIIIKPEPTEQKTKSVTINGKVIIMPEVITMGATPIDTGYLFYP